MLRCVLKLLILNTDPKVLYKETYRVQNITIELNIFFDNSHEKMHGNYGVHMV